MTDQKTKIDRRKATVTKYKTNPFRTEMVAEVQLGRKTLTFGTGNRAVDERTGECLGEAAYRQTRVIDRSKFIMMYQAMQNAFWQLSPRAQKVLRVVFYEVSERAIGKDEIYLNWPIAEEVFSQEGMKVGRATYFRGVAELIEKKVIAESTRQNIYFINPTLMFNGNRATFIQQIISDDPALLDEAQEIIAKRALEASRQLDGKTLKEIGESVKK
jgi:hypothetical protein